MKKTAFILAVCIFLSSCSSIGLSNTATDSTDLTSSATQTETETTADTTGKETGEPVKKNPTEITYTFNQYRPSYNPETDFVDKVNYADREITLHIPLGEFSSDQYFSNIQLKNKGGYILYGAFLYKADDGYDIKGGRIPHECYILNFKEFYPKEITTAPAEEISKITDRIDGDRVTKTGFKYYYQICASEEGHEDEQYTETVYFCVAGNYYISLEYRISKDILDDWLECLNNVTFEVYDFDPSTITE